jgi:hypothetical protein
MYRRACAASARGGNIVRVSGAAALRNALANAKPGDMIVLADGTYSGDFTLTKSGTAVP